MQKLLYRIKPESGIAHLLHTLLNILLPLITLCLIRINFVPLAVVLVILSKWRILAVKPRYWLSNIRSNLVDIFIGLSVVAFMSITNKLYVQIIWMIFYIFWLVWFKPKSKTIPVMIQALLAQALALIAFYRAFPSSSLVISIIVTWLICYACARHFLGAFQEPLINPISQIWAWFGAVMAWILGHWLIEYLFLPQVALILTIIGYGLATLYYLSETKKLKTALRSQIIVIICILLLIIIVFSDWQDKTI